MKRRSFLSWLGIAPAVAVAASLPASASTDPVEDLRDGYSRIVVPSGIYPPGYHRLSIEMDDPGSAPLADFLADYGCPKILLNGVLEPRCITVDAVEGWVKRYRRSPDGNLSILNGEIVTEIVHGHVEIWKPADIAPFMSADGKMKIDRRSGEIEFSA